MPNSNMDKNRKPEEQKVFEQMDNEGAFAREDGATGEAYLGSGQDVSGRADEDYEDREAQNVSDDGQRLEGEEAERARNKAEEGIRQGRED
ncbi:MAG TPA: hypothetical protein VHK69_07115 [Chitinophagaceae bacterium]|jgi:hypothetical protein|nr:hypothetical protein [Chitinophagaceae bacterium]